ncbi:chromosome transmission fidelity protein 8 [[Candida] anglica]|uniref:Chromosome transmission fidelity protein 8 n=1 Tax=[Candida] anglica TaxID=148631 RepID=A0ABP0E696_9ASCO
MPCVDIDCSSVGSTATEKPPNVISTPLGLAIVEIQGELNLPQTQPSRDANPEYLANFATVDDIYTAVRFGSLELDPKDEEKAVVYIGKSQRLMGKLVNLDTPLGVLRLGSKDIKMVDIIYKKLIFKDRPLPIM